MAARPEGKPPRGRIATGVPGLDTVLGGGLIQSGLYLMEGVAGAGKTILASQIAFNHARRGESIVMMTLVAESHGKMLDHLRNFGFFDEQVVGRQLLLVSGFGSLLDGGLDGLLRFIARVLHERAPSVLILDGFAAVRELCESTPGIARFIHDLNTLVTTVDCTTIMLAPITGSVPRPEHTLVDGLIELNRVHRGLRRAREIEVHKMRGGRHLTGQHVFVIESSGICVYPRLETIVTERRIAPGMRMERLTTGIEGFDAVVGGGLMSGSATSLLGAPGAGKTLWGLSFLAAGARRGEPSLYLGFYETPARLLAKGRSVGLDLDAPVENGMLLFDWYAPLEIFLDRIAQRLEEQVVRHRVQRVFIDGVEGFCGAAMHPERAPQFLTALTTLLRGCGVTTVLSEELPIYSATIDTDVLSISALVENLILIRYFEHHAELKRLVSVIKMRDSDFDSAIREFTITPQGLRLGGRVSGVQGLLTGRASPGGRADE